MAAFGRRRVLRPANHAKVAPSTVEVIARHMIDDVERLLLAVAALAGLEVLHQEVRVLELARR